MPNKRKDREYYSDKMVTVGQILDKYSAIKETFECDKVLMNTGVNVTEEMLGGMNLSNKKS